MAFQNKLVNKQFNTPINLYSKQNIQEVLDRDTQILSNGAVGINFHNPAVGKPANLQNSAVLRMLEEEEHRQRNGFHGIESGPKPLRGHLNWPPPEYETKRRHGSSFSDVVIPGTKRVAWPPLEGENEEGAIEPQGGPQNSSRATPAINNNSPVEQPVTSNPVNRTPLKPLNISCAAPTTYQQSPKSPNLNQGPTGFRSSTPNKQWAPVHSPILSPHTSLLQSFGQENKNISQYQVSTDTSYEYQQQSNYQPQQYPRVQQSPNPQPQYLPTQQQLHRTVQPQSQPPTQRSPRVVQIPIQYPSQVSTLPAAPSTQNQSRLYQPQVTTRAVEAPPSTITLRTQAPVSQAPPPVFTSQPATATLRGGKNLRGDLKWPPEPVKQQAEEENRARLELAKGPACRPRKVHKDYSGFFAQHALNSSYPGYKAPPGTQYYGASDY